MLAEEQKGGGTLRQHYESAATQGADVPELNKAPLPSVCNYLWVWFLDVGRSRNSGMGVGAIPASEWRAWKVDNDITPTMLEMDIMKAMDAAFVSHYAEKCKKQVEESQA